jgi:flagellum-specific peptidoglycan hydrolase FlgJ
MILRKVLFIAIASGSIAFLIITGLRSYIVDYYNRANLIDSVSTHVVDKEYVVKRPKVKTFNIVKASVVKSPSKAKYIPSIVSAKLIYENGSMDAVQMQSHKDAYVSDLLPILVKLRQDYDFSIPTALAQSWYESNFGTSWLAINANQYFGVKYSESLFKDIKKNTGKEIVRSVVRRKDDCGSKECSFVKLESRWSSFFIYAYIIDRTYAKRVKKGSEPKYARFAKALMSGNKTNYSTQKGYASSIIKIVKDNGWDKYEDITYEQALIFQEKLRQ